MSLQINFDCSINDLIDKVCSTKERNSLNDRYFDDGQGRFISWQSDGIVHAASNHLTKWHSATAQSTKITGKHTAKSEAPPGVWAIAYIDSGNFGVDRTFYNSWD